MSRAIILVPLILLVLVASLQPAYAWSSSPMITANGNVLTIQFDFSQMSSPPTSAHHPVAYQVRVSSNGGSTWTTLDPVTIATIPSTTVFTETYTLPSSANGLEAQARLQCSIHGWSDWGPDPATPIPEFQFAPLVALSALAASLYILKCKA